MNLHPTPDQKVIAAFDFDGTIIKRDSLPLFIRHAVSFRKLLYGSLMMSPFLILFKLRLMRNDLAKERLFRIFLKGLKISQLSHITTGFAEVIDKVVDPAAIDKIKWHQSMNHEVIIVSASAEEWIRPWANRYGINTILATCLESNDGTLTGRFNTNNCHGPEKVRRLLAQYPDRKEYILYAYGDSRGDRELLEMADHSFYRSF